MRAGLWIVDALFTPFRGAEAYGSINSTTRRNPVSHAKALLRSPRWFVVGASMAIAVAVSACGVAATQTTVGGAQAVPGQAGAGVQPSAAAATLQRVAMQAKEFSFSPNVVHLKLGQPVQLTIANIGVVNHDIKSALPISDLKYLSADNPVGEQQSNAKRAVFDVDFHSGHTAQVTFVPTKAGQYTFFCDEPGHKEAGMTGTFVVRG